MTGTDFDRQLADASAKTGLPVGELCALCVAFLANGILVAEILDRVKAELLRRVTAGESAPRRPLAS